MWCRSGICFIVAFVLVCSGCGEDPKEPGAPVSNPPAVESVEESDAQTCDFTDPEGKLKPIGPDWTPPAGDAVQVLDAYVGYRLRHVDRNKLEPLFSLIRPLPDDFSHRLVPWYVWRMGEAGKPRYVVFEGQWLHIIPGNSSAAIHLFDEKGKKLDARYFLTGWRIDIWRAETSQDEELNEDIIEIRSRPVINGRSVKKQFFAFSANRLRFIRMEDFDGKLIRNWYRWPNHTIGVLPEADSVPGFVELLKSDEPADLLSALAFLGGSHLDPDNPLPGHVEDLKQATLFRDLCRSPEVATLVKVHQPSNVKWVKEAADLADVSMNELPPGSGE